MGRTWCIGVGSLLPHYTAREPAASPLGEAFPQSKGKQYIQESLQNVPRLVLASALGCSGAQCRDHSSREAHLGWTTSRCRM